MQHSQVLILKSGDFQIVLHLSLVSVKQEDLSKETDLDNIHFLLPILVYLIYRPRTHLEGQLSMGLFKINTWHQGEEKTWNPI